MPMLSMQLRSLGVRVRAQAGSFLIIFENVHPRSSVLLFLFRVYERCKKSTSPSGDWGRNCAGVYTGDNERLWQKKADFVVLQGEIGMWLSIGEDTVWFSGTSSGCPMGFIVGIGMWIWMGVGEDGRCVICVFGVYEVMWNEGETRNPPWFSG